MNELEPILARVSSRLPERRAALPEAELRERARARAEAGEFRDFAGALSGPGLAVIAEHKRSSPSAGAIRADLELEHVVQAYHRGGAAALSVLSEPDFFGGSLEDLAAARAATPLPILRKDFILEEYQLLEAAAFGADAVLLIVAAMPAGRLAELQAAAGELGLATLVEVHDEAELQAAIELGAPIIGINNRDLTTLEVDPDRAPALAAAIPPGRVVVAESGYRTRAQLEALQAAGIDAVLIGEALMRAPDLEQALLALRPPS